MMTTLSQGNGRTGLSGQESRFLNSGQYTVMCQYVLGSDALGLTGDTHPVPPAWLSEGCTGRELVYIKLYA